MVRRGFGEGLHLMFCFVLFCFVLFLVTFRNIEGHLELKFDV